jgi:hypothetical protein
MRVAAESNQGDTQNGPYSPAQQSKRVFAKGLKNAGIFASIIYGSDAAMARMDTPRWNQDGSRNPRSTESFEYNKARETVKTYFPNAVDGKTVLTRATSILHKKGVTSENTLFAQSVCPDEINHSAGDLTSLFRDQLGSTEFQLGK